jgi:hypothetical protein
LQKFRNEAWNLVLLALDITLLDMDVPTFDTAYIYQALEKCLCPSASDDGVSRRSQIPDQRYVPVLLGLSDAQRNKCG